MYQKKENGRIPTWNRVGCGHEIIDSKKPYQQYESNMLTTTSEFSFKEIALNS